LKFANKFCYSARTLSKKTVFRSGLNFTVEIRSGWERRVPIQVLLRRHPGSLPLIAPSSSATTQFRARAVKADRRSSHLNLIPEKLRKVA